MSGMCGGYVVIEIAVSAARYCNISHIYITPRIVADLTIEMAS